MKKIIKSILSISVVLFTGLSLCHGAPFWVGGQNPDAQFPFPNDSTKRIECADNTDLGSCVSINEDRKGGDDETIIRRLLHVLSIDVDESSEHKFLDYVKAILNVALGLLSMVALVMTIYTFYLMFFTENEAGVKKAKGNLIGIFIALAIIGLSWLIVSFIFRWYESNWQSRQGEIESGNITKVINHELNDKIYLNV